MVQAQGRNQAGVEPTKSKGVFFLKNHYKIYKWNFIDLDFGIYNLHLAGGYVITPSSCIT